MLAAAVAASLLFAAAAPATAQVARPLSGELSAAAEDALTPVYWRGRGAAIGAGIAAGLLLGGVLAGRPYYWGYGAPYYGPPPPVYYAPPVDPDAVAYCARRFKSYDPASGTYLGYDGIRHPCP
jgi:hypothetical protein